MDEADRQFVTVILGGTGSVGQELASQLSTSGHTVIIGGRDEGKLAAARERGFETCRIDAAEPGSIAACIESAAENHGRVTGVVNCIGSILLKPAHLTTDEEFAQVVRTNLTSSFEAVRGAAKVMRKMGGSVVLVSTAAARIGLANHEAIAASKAGVEGLARSAAATYARSGLRVNVVAPGLVRSEMSRSLWENESAAETSRQMHPLGRIGEPQDIASAIAWLLEPTSDWMTGQVIGVDGGLGAILPRQCPA